MATVQVRRSLLTGGLAARPRGAAPLPAEPDPVGAKARMRRGHAAQSAFASYIHQIGLSAVR